MSDFGTFGPASGPAETLNLESFWRRRRTKVLEEQTRGVQVSVYGDLVSWLMQGAAE
jgi:hypothetical protein